MQVDEQTIAIMGRPATTATAPSIRSRSSAGSPSTAASGCTSTAASAGSSCRSARSSATTCRPSTSACPGSPASRPTPTSTATRSRAPACCSSATRPAQRAVLPPRRLERRQVHVAGHRGLALRGAARGDLGRDGAATGREGYLALRPGDLRDRGRDEGRGPHASRAAHPGQPDVLLQLHLRRVRHLPRQRPHATAGLALQRPAVPQRHPHGRDPAADPAGGRRAVRRGPRRGRGLRPGAASRRRGGVQRRHLRRGRRAG